MKVILLTVLFSLALVWVFVAFFVYLRRSRSSDAFRDGMLPFTDETAVPRAVPPTVKTTLIPTHKITPL